MEKKTKKKRKDTSRRKRRKKRRREGEASSNAHRLLYTYPPIIHLSLSRFLPLSLSFSLISTFLPSFSLHLLPLSLTLHVTFPARIAHPHATREREREDRALGPWRNQFKWLSVDVIDFHFTRLSRGRRSSTRCAASTPTPEQLQPVLHPRVSPSLTLILSLSLSRRIFRLTFYLFLSTTILLFSSFSCQPHTRAAHTRATSNA